MGMCVQSSLATNLHGVGLQICGMTSPEHFLSPQIAHLRIFLTRVRQQLVIRVKATTQRAQSLRWVTWGCVGLYIGFMPIVGFVASVKSWSRMVQVMFLLEPQWSRSTLQLKPVNTISKRLGWGIVSRAKWELFNPTVLAGTCKTRVEDLLGFGFL